MNHFSILLIFISSLFFLQPVHLLSQSSDDDMVISSQNCTYTFAVEKNQVIVDEKQDVAYSCEKNVQPVNFSRFYDLNSEITKIKVKGVKATPAQYESYSRENIFYDDSKVCHLNLLFKGKNEIGTVTYQKKYKDVYGFSLINIVEPHYIKNKTIRIIVPQWMEVEIVENNLGANINKTISADPVSGDSVYTYHIQNQDAYKHEDFMPDYTLTFPYIRIVPRKSVVNKKTEEYFYSFKHMYDWCKKMADLTQNDHAVVAQLAGEITRGSETDSEKINALLGWVQNNIRYVAFEYDIQGFKPDEAQSVIKKKYGDCKGMSNLLKCLLLAEGFDARLVWVNTTEAGHEWTLPIPFADHMICCLFHEGEFHFLDPTVKFMPFGEIAYPIQGKMAMVEDSDNYMMIRSPAFPPSHNLTRLVSRYKVDGGRLDGESELSFGGESKYGMVYSIRYAGKTDIDRYMENFLRRNNPADSILDISVKGIETGPENLAISYRDLRPSCVSSFSGELYIDLDVSKDFAAMTIDTLKRKNDFAFPYSETYVSDIRFDIPDGYRVKDLPPDTEIDRDYYIFSIRYTVNDNSILYQKEITLKKTTLPKSHFHQWNRDLTALRNAYSRQITLQEI